MGSYRGMLWDRILKLDKSDCSDKLSMENHQVIFKKRQTNTIIAFPN